MKVSWKREKLVVTGTRGAWSYTLTLPDGAVMHRDGFTTKRAARSHARAEAEAWWVEHQHDTIGVPPVVSLPWLSGELCIERLKYARAYWWRLYTPGGEVVADGIQSSVRGCEIDAHLESVNARTLLEELLGAVDVDAVLERLIDGNAVEVGDVRFAPHYSRFRAGRWAWRVGDESGVAGSAADAVIAAHAAGQVVYPVPHCIECGDVGLVRPRDARDTSDLIGCPVCDPDPNPFLDEVLPF